jgi:hypothetical protein
MESQFRQQQQAQQRYTQQQQPPKQKVGNINIDYVPDNGKNKKTFDGGEYVDYEEVK